MRRFIFCLILLGSFPVFADILIPPDKLAEAERDYKRGLENCPKDKPLYNGDECYSCDELETVGIASYMKCSEICPNRYSRYECGLACILKNSPGNDYNYVQCRGWIKECPKGSFQDRQEGKCYTCTDVDQSAGLPIALEDCLTCPNTQFKEGLCYPKCPKDKPLLVDGKCESCDLTERSGYVISGCKQCSNRLSIRGEGCYQKCPKNKPLLGLDTGECFSCDDKQFDEKSNWQPRDYRVLNCSKCPNKINKVRCLGMKSAK